MYATQYISKKNFENFFKIDFIADVYKKTKKKSKKYLRLQISKLQKIYRYIN